MCLLAKCSVRVKFEGVGWNEIKWQKNISTTTNCWFSHLSSWLWSTLGARTDTGSLYIASGLQSPPCMRQVLRMGHIRRILAVDSHVRWMLLLLLPLILLLLLLLLCHQLTYWIKSNYCRQMSSGCMIAIFGEGRRTAGLNYLDDFHNQPRIAQWCCPWPWSLVVLKDNLAVLGPGLGLEG